MVGKLEILASDSTRKERLLLAFAFARWLVVGILGGYALAWAEGSSSDLALVVACAVAYGFFDAAGLRVARTSSKRFTLPETDR